MEFLQHDVHRKIYMVIVLTDSGDELIGIPYTWEWWMDGNEGCCINWTFPKCTNEKSILISALKSRGQWTRTTWCKSTYLQCSRYNCFWSLCTYYIKAAISDVSSRGIEWKKILCPSVSISILHNFFYSSIASISIFVR